jgi:hypothetical protein
VNSATEPADLVLAHRYGEAWNAHELAEIMEMQVAEIEFELKLAGYPLAQGAVVAEQFRFFPRGIS